MVYAVQGELAFSNAVRRNTILTGINAFILTRTRWGTSTATAQPVEPGANGILLDMRFMTRLDADAFRAYIELTCTGQNKPLAGSYMRSHDCRHDAANPQPCTGLTTRMW